MVKKIKIIEALRLNETIQKLMNAQIAFPMNVSFELFKIHKKLNQVEEFLFCRIKNIFGEDFKIMSMTNEQKCIYNDIMNEEIEIDINPLEKEDFETIKNVNITIEDANNISLCFSN